MELKKILIVPLMICFLNSCNHLDVDTQSYRLYLRTKHKSGKVLCKYRKFKLSNVDGNAGMVWTGPIKKGRPVSECDDMVGFTPDGYREFKPDIDEIIEKIGDERDNGN